MNLAPIVVFSYNRPEHLRRTLEALSRNDFASESVLYIFCDGPKEGATEDMQKRISENVAVAKSQTWSKELYVIVQDKNKGLADSIINGVTVVINRYGRIIMLEDDIVTSRGFLRFMNEALEMYKDDEQVMHISAYMYPHKGYLPATFFYPVPYPGGGWATWARAWKYFNNNTQELFDYWHNRWGEFDLYGGDILSHQLCENLNGSLKTWFIKWYAVMLQRGALTLYPGRSLTNNIGFDASATNCSATTNFNVVPVDYVPIKRRTIRVNKYAMHVIYDFYQGHWYNRRRRKKLLKKVLVFLYIWR